MHVLGDAFVVLGQHPATGRLDQPALDGDGLAEIADGGDDAVVVEGGQRDVRREGGAVTPTGIQPGADPHHPAGGSLVETTAEPGVVPGAVLRHELLHPDTLEPVRVPEQAGRLPVGLADHSVVLHEQHRVG